MAESTRSKTAKWSSKLANCALLNSQFGQSSRSASQRAPPFNTSTASVPRPHTPVSRQHNSTITPQPRHMHLRSGTLRGANPTGHISISQGTQDHSQGGMTLFTSLSRRRSNCSNITTAGYDSAATWLREVNSATIVVNDPSKLTPPRATHLSNIATRLVHQAPKREQCIVIGVGDKQQVLDYAMEARHNSEAREQMRMVHVRALLDLVSPQHAFCISTTYSRLYSHTFTDPNGPWI